MSTQELTTQEKANASFLSSYALRDAYTDFVISRQAMRATPKTLKFYSYTLGGFLTWLERQGITTPEEVEARHVRAFLVNLEGKSSSTVHAFARAIKTLLRFWHAENYMPAAVKFAMPRVEQKRLPSLTAEEVSRVLAVCDTREKALILLMVDSGLRRAELCALNWADLDISTGLIRVIRGKGGKARSVVVGASTRRALLAYRRMIKPFENSSLIQTRQRTRITGWGLRQILRRLSVKTGIYMTPHALRRTFVALSLRAGMSLVHLAALMGHSSLELLSRYAQLIDNDLVEAHAAHSPVDNLPRLR